jgi:hypothetical protein
MSTTESQEEALRAELRDVQQEAAAARAALDSVRRGLGRGGEGTIDSAEGAADLTAVEEQAALVDALETRERGLRARLGMD